MAGHAALAALLASLLAPAAGTNDPRFAVAGPEAFSQRAPALSGGPFLLRGDLQRTNDVAVGAVPAPAAPSLTWGGRFMVDASTAAAAASLVCYNDTIFRDAFDGDGA